MRAMWPLFLMVSGGVPCVKRVVQGSQAWKNPAGSCFRGGMLGVKATVRVHQTSGDQLFANVCLSGIPIGGRMTGTGYIDDEGKVQLDAELSKFLTRRFVEIPDIVQFCDFSDV